MSKILYVEDEEDYRIIVSQHLKGAGHKVLLAETTAEGLALAQAELPDLVLMDIKFGDDETAGFVATRSLKADPRLRQIPIIAVTAFIEAEKRTEALRAGCDDLIVRPVNFPQLLKRIEDLTAAARTGSSPPDSPDAMHP